MEVNPHPQSDSKNKLPLKTTNPLRLLSQGLDTEAAQQIENDFFALLHTINEEAMQLGEFIATETKTVYEICGNLQYVFHHLGLSVDLPSSLITWRRNVQKATYNDHGHLILVMTNGEIESKALEQLSPEIVLTVVWGVIPKLGEIVSTRLKHAETRISLFEKIRVNLRNLQNNLSTSVDSETQDSRELQEQQVQEFYLPVES
jgi:hypothetical protein